jgi:hypothetical protein
MNDFEGLVARLNEHGVLYIVVGGMAATAFGSVRVTYDLDLVYARTPDNIARLVAALRDVEPSLRGAPPGLPFRFDVPTVQAGLNFTLTTRLGPIDALGEITGGGGYDQLVPHAVEIEMLGVRCRCLGLDKLIAVKRAAGRPRDLEVVAELEILRDMRDSPS